MTRFRIAPPEEADVNAQAASRPLARARLPCWRRRRCCARPAPRRRRPRRPRAVRRPRQSASRRRHPAEGPGHPARRPSSGRSPDAVRHLGRRSAGRDADDQAGHSGGPEAHVPVIVAYNLPDRDACGKFSAGRRCPRRAISAGSTSWRRRSGSGDDIVIVEPDGLADIIRHCLTPAGSAERYKLLRYAMRKLGALPHAQVYLDAGNPGMFANPAALAGPLDRAGVLYGRGFSANVSNFQWTGLVAAGASRWSARSAGSSARSSTPAATATAPTPGPSCRSGATRPAGRSGSGPGWTRGRPASPPTCGSRTRARATGRATAARRGPVLAAVRARPGQRGPSSDLQDRSGPPRPRLPASPGGASRSCWGCCGCWTACCSSSRRRPLRSSPSRSSPRPGRGSRASSRARSAKLVRVIVAHQPADHRCGLRADPARARRRHPLRADRPPCAGRLGDLGAAGLVPG